MAILYGILIAALMGLSAYTGFVLCLKVKGKPDIRFVTPGGGEEADIMKRGFQQFNVEEPPATATDMAKRFRRTHSEELKHASRVQKPLP